jgi:hypothetical protein
MEGQRSRRPTPCLPPCAAGSPCGDSPEPPADGCLTLPAQVMHSNMCKASKSRSLQLVQVPVPLYAGNEG